MFVMKTLNEKIKELREKKGWTQFQLAEAINISRPVIAKIETTDFAPSIEIIKNIAEIFGVSTDFLIGKEGNITLQMRTHETYPVGPTVILPIYGSVSAGPTCIAEQKLEGYQVVDTSAVNGDVSNYFWLRASGDSMQEIGIFDGSLLLVHRQDSIEDNEVAVVIVNSDEATVKRVRFTGDMVMLIPENRNYSPQFFSRNDVQICGRVKKVLSSIL
jgi:repressor LexA